MTNRDGYVPRTGWRKLLTSFLICVICVAVNIIGAQIATLLHVPLYLDCVGTVVASMAGGFLPGVIVGYLTNTILGLVDGVSLYYTIINVLIAVAAASFSHMGWFKSVAKTLLAIVTFALIGGALASILTWCLYGFSVGEGITAPFVHQLCEGGVSPFVAQLAADTAVDVVDKAIVTVLALLITRVLPHEFFELFDFSAWQQNPLSSGELALVRATKSRVASVRTKVVFLVSIVMIAVVGATTWLSYLMLENSMIEEQEANGVGIASLAAEAIDPKMVDEYLSQGASSASYQSTLQHLINIRKSFPEVQYVYAYKILDDGCHVVLDSGGEDEPGSDPGTVIEFESAFEPYRADLLAGRPIKPIISTGLYGWLLTVYQPLLDAQGNCVCYVGVDIQMTHVLNEVYAYLAKVVSLFGAFFILICTIVLWMAKYGIILPLNSIARAAGNFAFGTESDRTGTVEQVRSLDIHTGDEIENLYHSVTKTAEDTVRYIADAEEKSRTIERMQDNLIMVMADLVESRDQYTGDHVRKTGEYASLIMRQMRSEGIYADELTDELIFNIERSAPLHDIGKIVVSDTILNKPGRLTDEEFEIMKSHTTAGREIIKRAVGAVSEPTYLDEAKNISEFHHEKWNGTGYPTGRAGKEIPLSARIMAVADVFDALVSRRSYKDGFPLEKAFSIIEEGAGSHFDPEVAAAFLHARGEAAAIARKYGDGQTDREGGVDEGTAK